MFGLGRYDTRQQLRMSQNRLTEINKIIRTIYVDRANGLINDESFKEFMQDFEHERNTRTKEIQELQSKIEQCERTVCDVDAWVKSVHKYVELEELTQEILIELIDCIEVFAPVKVDKQRIFQIRINYRFVGDISNALVDSAIDTVGGDVFVQAN